MKKEINPAVAVVIVIVILGLIGGYFLWSQSYHVDPNATNLIGPDGKKHYPHAAGGGGGQKQ